MAWLKLCVLTHPCNTHTPHTVNTHTHTHSQGHTHTQTHTPIRQSRGGQYTLSVTLPTGGLIRLQTRQKGSCSRNVSTRYRHHRHQITESWTRRLDVSCLIDPRDPLISTHEGCSHPGQHGWFSFIFSCMLFNTINHFKKKMFSYN